MSHSETSPGGATIRVVPGQGLRVELPALRLRVLAGPDKGERVDLSLDLVRVGTGDDNDLVLSDPKVSRRHVELRRVDDRLQLRDLGSTNGCWVGGAQVTEGYLEPGQAFRVGETDLVVETRKDSRAGLVGNDDRLGELVGASAPMRELYGVLRAVAETHATVLVQGESGTGKELVARTLHELSGRKGNLVVFDATSAEPEMVRSDLFGHKKGAFTGAQEDRAGAFRKAHGGTLFIDEIGEIPLDLQARLLRVLEAREVTPLGADEPIPIDVRIVAATHRDLAAMVEEGTFRHDLYHRLAVVPVRTPPLRERTEDIPLLIGHLRERLGITNPLSRDAEEALASHGWPGNVRELRNVLERAGALAAGGTIEPRHLRLVEARGFAPGATRDAAPAATSTEPAVPRPTSGATMEDVERDTILAALERNGGNKAATARELEISLSTLHRRLRKYQGKA
jgi:DNA-binding NtrC family response regulator